MINLNDDILIGFHASMEGYCLELLHQGYEAMLATKAYDVDWEEDTLTAHYIGFMDKLPLCREWQIDIVPQFYIYSDKHLEGEEAAKYAPRIDFRFMKWFKETKTEYFAEAKNLSEKNWTKKSGAFVSTSYYYPRYVKTGISHLLTEYYPNNCVLIAYVLNGDKNAVLSNLNNLISSDFIDYGIITKPKTTCNEEYYISENTLSSNRITIKHLFLQLYTQEHKRNDEIDKVINQQKKKLERATSEQKSRIEQQISLLEYVKTEKFQGESGVLRINLAWNTTDDLDLYIETGEGEINYKQKELGFGKLDIDANANEPFTNNPQENIVFTQIPNGKCKIKVHFYKNRENKEIDFVLSILTPNDDIKVFLKSVNTEKPMIDVSEFEFEDEKLIIH